MFPFHGVDFMEIDSLFSDEDKLVRQTVREFVDQEVLPHIEAWNREGKFPRHLVPLMADLGFTAPTWKGTAARACRTCSTGSSCRNSNAATAVCGVSFPCRERW